MVCSPPRRLKGGSPVDLVLMMVWIGLPLVGFLGIVVLVGVLLWKFGGGDGGRGPGGGFTGGGSTGF
jgi:hypothetical protein